MINKKGNSNLSHKNVQKVSKNFMYQNLKGSNFYSTNFTSSNFDYTSFRGAHYKSCDFYGCTFKFAEFVGTNFKKSKFKEAKFEDTLFDGVNLDGVDFKGATFKNVIFLDTDLSKAVNLNVVQSEVKIYDKMPELQISDKLKEALELAMTNEFIKAARVLDTKNHEINTLSVMRLLENFDEELLIKGLNLATEKVDKHFCILSYLIKFLKDSVV